ncbi:AlpA family phage regulatory protein [Bradyrhizobium japonicum]|uniref:helix-turn-helix transcriptional regulator n=1 Tax=Bradyrhizobium japonicum TaxID=375 RepID=UPI001BABDB4F|nr:AlpA family phage regulatory protein [Bradyrhizobium japonicum]MBR0733490.1 AlpA family phage regulatory protein [Bradyrhizobium japonicum]
MSTSKQTQVETDIAAAAHPAAARRMLNETQVLAIIPISRTTLYRMEKVGRFPKSTYISPNRRVWYEDEIVAWQNAVDEFDPHRARGKGRRARTIVAAGGKPDVR